MLVEYLRPTIPPAAQQRCPEPASLPDRDITETEATRLWGADRIALVVCEQQRAAAVAAVSETGKDE